MGGRIRHEPQPIGQRARYSATRGDPRPAGADGTLIARTSGFNLGECDDYRILDGGLVRERTKGLYRLTRRSRHRDPLARRPPAQKIPFYAKHGLEEIVILDPPQRSIQWLSLSADGSYAPIEHSALIALGPVELVQRIDWP